MKYTPLRSRPPQTHSLACLVLVWPEVWLAASILTPAFLLSDLVLFTTPETGNVCLISTQKIITTIQGHLCEKESTLAGEDLVKEHKPCEGTGKHTSAATLLP